MPRSRSISRLLPATTSLLLVDDDPRACQRVSRMIADADLRCSLTTANSLHEAREMVAGATFDLAILAHPLGDGAAFELLPGLRDTPTIVLIGTGSERLAAEALRRQPCQCLVRDDEGNYLHLLPAAINLALARRTTTRTQESLTLSDERYRSLFDAMTEGFALHEIVCDENGRPCDYRFLDVNPAFERLTGRRRADVVGKLKRAAIPGEDEFWIQTYGAVALGGPPVSFEHRSSISGRHWRVYAYSPAPRQFAALFSDITDRKQAEGALNEAEERFRAFMDNSPAIAWTKDERGRYVYLSRTYEERFGVRLEDWRGKTDFDVWPQETAESFRRNDEAVLQADHSISVTEETRNPDGTSTYWWNFKFPFQDASGRRYVGGIGVDITERRRAEAALQEAEDRFRAFMDNSPAVAWAKDEGPLYVYLSRTYEERFGVRLEDWRGKTDFDVWPGEMAERFRQSDEKVLHSGQSINGVEETQNPDGTWSSWWYFKFLFQDAAGRKYVGGIAVDITERKRAEEEVKKARDVLETRVRERTAELSAANEQLQQDITHRKEAEEKVQRHQAELAHVARLSTMGELATGLAHEINQPLCAITNYVQGCIHRLGSWQFQADELRDALAHAVAEAERAAEIIRRLRNFVLKRGPHRSSVNINELICDVAQLSAAELRQRQVHVEFRLAHELPLLLADSIQIQQVVLNLIRNGFEALEDTDPPRILAIESRVDGGNAVEVIVQDNGRGLPVKDAEQVFAPFYTTKPNGLGMGLSISRSIVEAHGGRLWASVTLRGAEFHFTLPVAAEETSGA